MIQMPKNYMSLYTVKNRSTGMPLGTDEDSNIYNSQLHP